MLDQLQEALLTNQQLKACASLTFFRATAQVPEEVAQHASTVSPAGRVTLALSTTASVSYPHRTVHNDDNSWTTILEAVGIRLFCDC